MSTKPTLDSEGWHRREFMEVTVAAGAAAALPGVPAATPKAIAQVKTAAYQITLLQNALLSRFSKQIAHAYRSQEQGLSDFLLDEVLGVIEYSDTQMERLLKRKHPFSALFKTMWDSPEAQQVRVLSKFTQDMMQVSLETFDAYRDGHMEAVNTVPDIIEEIRQLTEPKLREKPAKHEHENETSKPFYTHDTLTALEAMKRRGPEEHTWREKALQRFVMKNEKQK